SPRALRITDVTHPTDAGLPASAWSCVVALGIGRDGSFAGGYVRRRWSHRHRISEARSLLLLLFFTAFLVSSDRASANTATIQVRARSVTVDTRPDLEGIQSTATSVKDVATGVVSIVTGFTTEELQSVSVRARLVGPGLDTTVFGAPNALMPFPRLAVAGTYTLTTVELVDADTGAPVLSRDPSAPSAVFDVVDELLVTQVTSRALTLEEIEEAGIIISDDNFTAIEFAVGLSIGSEEVEIELPVLLPGPGVEEQQPVRPVFPTFGLGEGRGFDTVSIPNLSVSGFSATPPPEIEDEFELPPVTGLIIIPGNIAFLNQFFSVVVLTLNTGPEGSGLVVQNARARARLPGGPDGSIGTGDDPLGLAATNEFPDGARLCRSTTQICRICEQNFASR
ncbi:MAG: hypothetical protein AAF658_19940, partial [Myxococcota bacterium]